MGRSGRPSRSRSRSRSPRRSARRSSRSRSRERRHHSRERDEPRKDKGSSRDWDRERERRKRENELSRGSVQVVDLTDQPAVVHIDNDDNKDGDVEVVVDPEEEERRMQQLMGFGSFDSTKNKKVSGNNVGDVHLVTKRKYRQYMNRKGGFNRPLDSIF